VPWAVELYPGVYESCPITASYDYYEQFAPGDPAQYITAGAGSDEWAKTVCDPFSIVTEVPYFVSAKIGDETPIGRTRREVVLEGIDRGRRIYELLAKDLTATEGLITRPEGKLLRGAVETFVDSELKSIPSQERWARETSGMDQPATVAQEVDSIYVGVFYKMIVASMLARAIAGELGAENQEECCDGGYGCSCAPKRQILQPILSDLNSHIDRWASDIEENLAYEVVPIKDLIEVQYGALLVVLNAKGF